ncbi:TonB-dependent receptor [Chitinophaga niabensis]|uniref:TonB-dependent receptor n=1 Tax=Chitinophaga niabensis TaxID=536979 RepID=UPI0031BBC5D1
MKLSTLMLLIGFFQPRAEAEAQEVSLNIRNAPLAKVFNMLKKQTGYDFLYVSEELKRATPVTLQVTRKPLAEALKLCLTDQPLTFEIHNTTVLIKQKAEPPQQDKKVEGVVVDQKGEPIPGATVTAKGTKLGTTTDLQGKFSFSVPDNIAVIVVTYVGMKTVEVSTGQGLRVMLEATDEALNEVVVVGYGRLRKLSLTGSISSISNKDIITTRAPSLAVALAGKVPGLQIRQNNGTPGGFSTNINIRGMGTPMFVIDGVVRNEPTEFQKLNPEDIESITVLKDASAAIYGINSSNGVILVKTKSGTKGPLRVSYSGLAGVTRPTQHTKMMDVSQYWEIRNEDAFNSTGTPYFSSKQALEEAKALPYTNWYKEVFQQVAFQHQHNITIEGGTDKISTYTNIGYMTDNGLLRSGDIGYNKYSFRNGTTFQPNKYVKVELNLYGFTDYRKQPGTWDDAFFYLNKAAHGLIPSESVYANNNPLYYNRPRTFSDNPLQFSQRDIFGYGEWRDKFFQSFLAMTINVPNVEGLQLRFQGAYDGKTTIRTRVQKRAINYIYSATTDSYTPYNNYDPSIQEEAGTTTRLNFQGHILYNKQIAQHHNVGVVLVAEARQDNTRYLSGKRFYEGDLFTIDNIDRAPVTNQQTAGNTGVFKYASFIGRFNYDYRSKYLLEFAFREDGSYRYAPDKRWGFFPVISGGWRISEEPFLKNNTRVITDLKLRGSYGTTAQDAGNAFQFIPGYTSYNGYVLGDKFISGYTNAGLLNANLTWTTSKTADVGIDVSLWNGKLDFTFDLFRRNRTGLLATRAQALPNTFGAALPQENLNSDRTDGFEMSIGHKNRIGELEYGVSGNMYIGRTQMLYLERAPFRSSYDRWRNGAANRWQDIGWGYQVAGQYQNYDAIRNGVIETTSYGNSRTLPGDYMHLDVNGDGVINGKDQMPLFWNGQPKMGFGLNINASWRGLDFNMLWQGAGMYSLRYNEVLGRVLALDAANSPAFYYDRWHLADIYDPNSEWIPGKYPSTRRLDSDNGANYLESDIQRVDATYARLKNMEIGYRLPNSVLRFLGVSRFRCYVNLFNPLVICNSYLKSFDPEITDGNGFQYPLSKGYNFGVNLTF